MLSAYHVERAQSGPRRTHAMAIGADWPAGTDGDGIAGRRGESSVVFELVLDPPAAQPTRTSPNDDQCHRPRPSAVTARSGWLGASSAFRLLQP
jgi:hypothetical protein